MKLTIKSNNIEFSITVDELDEDSTIGDVIVELIIPALTALTYTDKTIAKFINYDALP